jgi:hypothetical protein
LTVACSPGSETQALEKIREACNDACEQAFSLLFQNLVMFDT